MKVIIVGCGRMGTGLSLKLAKKGHEVTVIDSNPEAFEKLGKEFKGTTVVGIGFDRDTLIQVEIDKSDAVVCCTESDEINAVISRIAKNIYRVPRVIARIYDQRKAIIYHKLGIQTLSTTTWGIERATEILTYSQLDSVYQMGSGNVNLVRIEVPSLLIGRTVNECTIIGEINVVSINRNGKAFIPTLGTILESGDLLYISAIASATDKLKSMLGLS